MKTGVHNFLSAFLTGITLVVAILDLQGQVGYEGAVEEGQTRPDALVFTIPDEIPVRDYFQFMDSLVAFYRLKVSYPLTEHLLVHANPWILPRLVNTDYYRLMARDSFVYDQRELVVLWKGDQILLPDSIKGERIHRRLKSFRLDINIPEFRLRIYQDSLELHSLPVRVGQNRKKYLAQIGRETDLRTRIGNGKIIRHERNPKFYNPVDGRRYYTTLRDDGKRTLMPQIPWIETEINGRRNGQMIHPTTNPATLEKAYSNGCIGTSEADAWILYYHAPLGTPVRIRYDLEITNPAGDTIRLKDIYGWGPQPR